MTSGASSAASAATEPTTTTSTTSSTTATSAATAKPTRLTRGALKKIANTTTTDGEQTLLQQYAEFQHGLPTPRAKRRRIGSSTSESTNENDQDHHNQQTGTDTADQENQTPANNTPGSTMAVTETPTKAAGAETPAKATPKPSEEESKIDSGTVEGKTVTVLTTILAPTVAEIALALEEKKLEGAPEGELFVVTVLTSSEIEAADDVNAEVAAVEDVLTVKSASANASGDAKEENELSWAKEYAALDSLRRLSIHHHEELKTLMGTTENRVVTQLVCPAAMNLRSAMVRNALMCIQDLVLAMKQDSEQFYGDIVPVLLQRTANEKQFIRDLARDALMTCVETSASEILLTEFLRISTTEKNAQIVSTKCIGRMDKSKLKVFVLTTHDSFMEELSAFLNCKVVECKAAARRMLQFLRRHVGETEFTALAKAKLEGTAQFELLKASKEKKTALAKSGLPKLSMRERMMQMKKQQQAASGAGPAAALPDDVVVLVPDAATR